MVKQNKFIWQIAFYSKKILHEVTQRRREDARRKLGKYGI